MTMYESAAQPRPSSRQNEIMRINLPKYAYKESPLHVQKETPIKIGHPYMLNSTYVKWFYQPLEVLIISTNFKQYLSL
jgi:hypothetical protein